MNKVIFKVLCDLEANRYHIKSTEPMYDYLNCICNSLSNCLQEELRITRELRPLRIQAVFIYE